MDKPILEIQGLTVSFQKKGKPVVYIPHLELPAKAFVCLVGESGSGKTVTSLLLTRLIRPAQVSGVVSWSGMGGARNMLALPENALRNFRGKQIGYIFQDPATSLNPVLKIGNQMIETYMNDYQRPKPIARKAVIDMLRRVRFENPERIFGLYPHEMSGGMKQRVMIAMAFLAGPKLLVADEPTTALDVSTEKEMTDLLIEMREKQPFAVLWITHNIRLACRIADKILVMKSGEIVESLERESGVFRPKSEYAKKLFAAGLSGVRPKSIIEV